MFRHYCVILRQLVINTLPRYASISNAAVGNTIYNYDVSHRFYASCTVVHLDFVLHNTKFDFPVYSISGCSYSAVPLLSVSSIDFDAAVFWRQLLGFTYCVKHVGV